MKVSKLSDLKDVKVGDAIDADEYINYPDPFVFEEGESIKDIDKKIAEHDKLMEQANLRKDKVFKSIEKYLSKNNEK